MLLALLLAAADFELLFTGDAYIRSFAYTHWGADNMIDTVVGLENEILRYRTSYLVFQFENETDMGLGAQPGMPFDPNRGRWTFELESRTELDRHFFELLMRHDCYHGIDRYYDGQDYKMTSAGIGFGSRGYLQKYRYKAAAANSGGFQLPARFEYYVNPSLYVPRAGFWQRSPYRARLEANVRFDLVQWKRVGLGLESGNVFYYSSTAEVQRAHRLSVQGFLYGDSHALIAFFSWWPYDDQVFRNRANKAVAGIELSF